MDQLLVTLTTWLRANAVLALPASLLWGMAAVLLSPCQMAAIPLVIAYVAGQREVPPPRRAAGYAVLFALGIFVSILLVGLACAAAGRILGDVGPWLPAAVGVFMLYIAWTLWQPPRCAVSSRITGRLQMQGAPGALVLGLGYGLLSGVCTFGFLAPILVLITVEHQISTGLAMLVLFGIGHCVPLVLCGMFSARAVELLGSRRGQRAVAALRRGAAMVVALLGVYFAAAPFV